MKEEIKDDYNLINSRAISDYNRMIKHKFNTEELAVLVHRNQRMSIEEKIEKYNDLIKNYPDMEVIERINCKHYASVKIMIKNEIQRLKTLNKKLIQNDENCIYTWAEYNKSTQKFECNVDIAHIFKTYKEAFKDIQDYIKEYDDTVSFRITKKYFDKRKNNIYADYNVKNKKSKLVDIVEENRDYLDIDNIFLNIPTPFKKGDILISNSTTGKFFVDNDVFVLDYLCTWEKDLENLLAEGNHDSSDMMGYGYYLVNEDTTEFVRDHKWNYDTFEYYDGKLTGRYRILKAISSFIKGKIGLELFVYAYDTYKTELLNERFFYTDEALKLAGMCEVENRLENMLKIVSGDIIENAKKYDVEAIVNPNNKYMDYGCGVCGAIYDAAGIEQIETYCHNKWIKDMEVNEIRITPGFYLKKEIIHVYAPIYTQEEYPIERLKECYLKLFDKIIAEKYKSVIIPSLATGFHRL